MSEASSNNAGLQKEKEKRKGTDRRMSEKKNEGTVTAAVVVAKRKGGIKGIPHVTKAVLAMTVEARAAWLVKAGEKLTAEHQAVLASNLAKAVANPPKAGSGKGSKVNVEKLIERLDFEGLSELIEKAQAALPTKATAEEAEAQKILDDQNRICAKAQAVIDAIRKQKAGIKTAKKVIA